MKKIARSCVVSILGLMGLLASMLGVAAHAETREIVLGWKYHEGDLAGAEGEDFSDAGWLEVVVPHDASISTAGGVSPFVPQAVAGADSGYLPGRTGWYRREIELSATEAEGVVRLEFEAIYMNAQVWINGRKVADHAYGYTSFNVDLTDRVKPGRNIIAVRFEHRDPSSRWYAGSGLIRPVTLELLDRLHIDPESIKVTTPVARSDIGEVHVALVARDRTGMAKETSVILHLRDHMDRIVATERQDLDFSSGADTGLRSTLRVTNPKLWSPEAPNLYRLDIKLHEGERLADERSLRVGIRTISVDAANGFRINGETVLLRGGNIHHDHYMLGAAGFAAAERRKVRLMKEAGYNAIRSAHNPASQATLDAADEMGMLVIDEAFDAWRRPKRENDYASLFAANWERDLESLIRSGRNHPSVVMWSIGNEIPEQGEQLGVETARMLAATVRQLDPTRPITQALNIDGPSSVEPFALLDVAGYNYRHHLFAEDREQFPNRVILSTESLSRDAAEVWKIVERQPGVIGDFVWTAVDYLGEAGIGWMGYSADWSTLGPYPWHLAYSGEIDATGRMRPAAYYRQILWDETGGNIALFAAQPNGTADLPDRNLHKTSPDHLDWALEDVHPNWTWRGQEGKLQKVVAYTRAPEVALFLNGNEIGRIPTGIERPYTAIFEVEYEPGRLSAHAINDGRIISIAELATAGEATTIVAQPEKGTLLADGRDLVYFVVRLFDNVGNEVYAQDDDRELTISVEGPATLQGFGNGNPIDPTGFTLATKRTYHGRAVGVLRAATEAGSVIVTISSDGLPDARIAIRSIAPHATAGK